MDQAKRQFTTVDEYILAFPEPVRTKLQELRLLIKDAVPEAEETIKYGMPTFTLHGNLVYFAAWKKHIGLYPITAAMEATLDELAAWKTSGKGTIQFPLDQPLPLPLIRSIVALRVRENLENDERRRQHGPR